MVAGHLGAVRKTDARRTDEGFEAVVDAVAVLVKRGAFPPRGFIVLPRRRCLLRDVKTEAIRCPLQAFCINSMPTGRLRFDEQRAGDRPHQQRKHDHGHRSTHVLPLNPPSLVWGINLTLTQRTMRPSGASGRTPA